MSLTVQEAVATLLKDGPIASQNLQSLTGKTGQLRQGVDAYQASLLHLQQGIEEQQAAIVKAAEALTQRLAECVTDLNSEIGTTDEAARLLEQFVRTTQAELSKEMAVATSKLKELSDELDKLPPVMREAVQHQEEALATSQKKVDASMGALKKTVTTAVSEYESLKNGVIKNQEIIGQHVQTLLTEVKKTEGQAWASTLNLDQNSASTISVFEQNVQTVMQSGLQEPSHQVKVAVELVQKTTQAEVSKQIEYLLSDGMNRLLRALDFTAQSSGGVLGELAYYVPGKLVEGMQTLGYVITHLDLILRELARRGIQGVTSALNRGIDWLAKATGLNLDWLKSGVNAIAEMAKLAVDYVTTPIALARTLITNPAGIWGEVTKLTTQATKTAEAVGKAVGMA